MVDDHRNLQVAVYGGGFSLLGKYYELTRIVFHRPSEVTVSGKIYAMDAQLMHKSVDGKQAILTVLFEEGMESSVVQTVLNNLPLEAGGEVEDTPKTSIDNQSACCRTTAGISPSVGSLTTPPCTEDVLWLVLMQPRDISLEQLAIFQRLYP